MDLYLIFKSSHRIVKDPTSADMEGAEILARRLNVQCRENLVSIQLMRFVEIDILSRVPPEDFIPDRISKFVAMSDAFRATLNDLLQAEWKIFHRHGIEALSSNLQNSPEIT